MSLRGSQHAEMTRNEIILQMIRDSGGTATRKQLCALWPQYVKKYEERDLDPKELAIEKPSGQPKYFHDVSGHLAGLKRDGRLSQPQRGIYKLLNQEISRQRLPPNHEVVDNLQEKWSRVVEAVPAGLRYSHAEKLIRGDHAIVRAIKERAEYRCQFPGCVALIKMKNGLSYVEVAHVEPVCEGGKSILGNLVVLCPNHHKEFDLGIRIIESQTAGCLTGTLNGRHFSITLVR